MRMRASFASRVARKVRSHAGSRSRCPRRAWRAPSSAPIADSHVRRVCAAFGRARRRVPYSRSSTARRSRRTSSASWWARRSRRRSRRAASRPSASRRWSPSRRAEGAPFVYRARVEVKPAFTLCDLKGLPAQRLATAVSDEDVERELESVRQRHAQFVEEGGRRRGGNGSPRHDGIRRPHRRRRSSRAARPRTSRSSSARAS